MKTIHQHLIAKSNLYRKWHLRPYYQHHHWLVFVASFLIAMYAIIGGWRTLVLEDALLSDLINTAYAQTAQVGADNMTFTDRKSAYLATLTGNLDPANLTPTVTMTTAADKAILDTRVNVLFGWLEKCLTVSSWSGKCKTPGNSGTVVEQTIQYFVSGSYWIHLGPKAQRGYAIIIPLRYQSVISTVAYNAVISRYSVNQVGQNDVYTVENENKLIMSAVGLYLYTEYYDPNATLTMYGCSTQCQKSWPEFTDRNGVKYTNGMTGNFNAKSLMQEFLINFIDEWMLANKGIKGQGEFDSLTYHRLYPEAMMILGTYAKDAGMKNRGKMAGDLMLLDALMDFSANSWGGTLGRTDYSKMSSTPRFPFRVLFGLSSNESEWDIPAVYSIGYTPPDVLVALSKFDETWRFHKEYNQQLHDVGKGKWNYLTPNYNIGSDVGPRNSGWQANVKGTGVEQFIRFFINADQAAPSLTQEGSYLGDKGYQLRNAMFVSLTGTAKLWEFPNGTSWQNPSTETSPTTGNTWDFRQLNNTYVAIQLKGQQAAVEVADASDGYTSFAVFKQAVKDNAKLTSFSFTTSKNQTISASNNCGLSSPGDCQFGTAGFDRMETESSAGKLIDWSSATKVMTAQKAGLQCVYNFNNWTYSGSSCGGTSGSGGQVISGQAPLTPILAYCGLTQASCSITPSVQSCGNNIKEGTEQCDGAQLGGATCPAGTTGTPTCSGCTLSYGACTSVTGIQTGGWDHTYPRLAYQHFRESPRDWYAKFDVVILTRPVAKTKTDTNAFNPKTKFIFTRSITAIDNNNPVDKCPQWISGWQAVRSDGSPALTGSGHIMGNMSNFSPLNSLGQKYNQGLPVCFTDIAKSRGWDGLGSDWVWEKPREATNNIDLDRSGDNDYQSHGAIWVDSEWAKGLSDFIKNWRVQIDSKLGSNAPLWLNTGKPHTDVEIAGVFENSNGPLLEKAQGHQDFAREWSAYKEWMLKGKKPSLWVTDARPAQSQWPASAGHSKENYRLMRMLLTFTMMGDGYFQFNPIEAGEHHWYEYYDEYDLKKVLGNPLNRGVAGPAEDAVELSNGALVRFFEGGVAIENPTGGPVTVTSSTLSAVDPSANKTYFLFRGNQDPQHNNGQAFTSITLLGQSYGSGAATYTVGDGIVLVRQANTAIVTDIFVDNTNHFTSPASREAQITESWVDILHNWTAFTHDDDKGRGTYALKYLPKDSAGSALFHPTINVAGNYEVFEWHGDMTKSGVDKEFDWNIGGVLVDKFNTGEASPGTGATSVTHQIIHAGGTAVQTVNQSINTGRWNSLGTYNFTGATGQGVRITTNGDINIVQADAIKFVYKGQ